MVEISPDNNANENKHSSFLQAQNQLSHADSSNATYRATPQSLRTLDNTQAPNGLNFLDASNAPPITQDPFIGSQSFPRNVTQSSVSRSISFPQPSAVDNNESTPSLVGTSSNYPASRPITPCSSSAAGPVLTPLPPALINSSINSARTSGVTSDSRTSGPNRPQNLQPNSSTNSLSSLRSFRSTSSNSPLYMFKKPPLDLKLPFINQDAGPSEVDEFMELNKQRQTRRTRGCFRQSSFKVFWLFLIACTTYFVFVGLPLWDGVVYTCWKWVHGSLMSKYGLLAFLLWGTVITWFPLLFCTFESKVDDSEKRDASETCLIIPAYKAAGALKETIPHALKIFKPEQIFIMANGNSPTPLDDTENVCKEFGVNHFWVPVGSKIVAEFVGVYMARKYKYCFLTDDDVHLPPNLPIVTDRIKGNTACVGYTIKSTGANGTKGTVFQQAQDVEYKLAGISKVFQSKYGSATFPHGAIILWDRFILEKLFFGHPGYHISEDWYFGHTCRSAGYRVDFCSQVFVETETPPCLFIPTKSTRGGYGEMTIWKQRFYRWNFFFVYRLLNDIPYLFLAWRLGWREIITKLFVFAEVYGTLLYLCRPFMLPLMLAADWGMTLAMTAVMMGVYMLGFIFFNIFHLRRKNEMIAWKVLPVYFCMKFALMFVDTASVYHSLYAYAKFFSIRHSRVVEHQQALEAVKMFLERQGRD